MFYLPMKFGVDTFYSFCVMDKIMSRMEGNYMLSLWAKEHKKSQFAAESGKYLGHFFSPKGLAVNPNKIH